MDVPAVTHLADPETLRGDELEIRDRAYRHLFRSRRLAVGDSLRIVDGQGLARLGVIHGVDRQSARVRLGEALPSNEPELRLHLKVGAPRPERVDQLVEKATELGVYSITLMTTERSPRTYGEARLERLRRLAAGAVEQSRRSRLPRLEGVLPWESVLDELPETSCYVLHPAETSAREVLGRDPGPDVTVLIGPEGGFSDGEIEALRRRGVTGIGLAAGILRVETAALAACVLTLLR